MITTINMNETEAKPVKQETCPCGRKFTQKTTGKYCLDCKVLRMRPEGRKHYADLIK